MDYQEKTVKLKNGKVCVIRQAEETDAEAMVAYLKTVFGETPYLTREPEDMTLTVEKEREILRENLASDTKLLLLAEAEGEQAGAANLRPVGVGNRASHRCGVGVSLRRTFWGMGIGTALMEELLAAARSAGYEQAELEVVSTNEAAVALYRKFGFETTGTVPHAFKYRDGTYADFLFMVKKLV